MAGFATRDAVIAGLRTKQDVYTFVKAGPVPEGINVMSSYWTGNGLPAAGAAPAATPGIAYDSDSASPVAGSIYFPDRSPDIKHLVEFTVGAYSAGAQNVAAQTIILYDRLVGVGSVSLASTGAKTVNSAALTRYTGTDAKDLEVWLEVSTATTVTAPVVNISSYTSSDGSNGLAGPSVTFPAAATNTSVIVPLPLNEGERGVRSVEEINVGTAASAGVCNILIVKRLATIAIPGALNTAGSQYASAHVNFLDDFLTLPRIYDNACLGLAIIAQTGNVTSLQGVITVAYG